MSAERPRFSLTVLGGCALARADGELVTGRAAQRRRLACLALIATAGRRGTGRDRLLGLLWPESASEQARHRLADTLHVLRAALGDDALVSAGDRLAVDAGVVACDAVTFDEALRRDDAAAAAAAYAGPFLDGFHVDDAPDFERWVDGERDRRARAAAGAFEAVAEQRARAGDHRGAVTWWRRLAAHDPCDAHGAVRLMQALDAAGDRAGALRHAEVYAALVRESLGVEADGEVVALAERLRREAPSRVRAAAPTFPAPAVPVRAGDPGQAGGPGDADSAADDTSWAACQDARATPAAPPSDSRPPAPNPASGRGRRRSALAWLASGVAVVAAGAAAVRARDEPPSYASVRARFALSAPPGERHVGARHTVAVSPDGRTVAYLTVDSAGVRRLRVRRVDELGDRALPGTEGASGAFFSPDGRWIGYIGASGIYKVPIVGGGPVLLQAAAQHVGASWTAAGDVVLGMGRSGVERRLTRGLSRLPAAGGRARPLTRPDTARGDLRHRSPVVLADGETVLFESVGRADGGAREHGAIGVASLATGRHTVLALPGRYPLGVYDGRLYYAGDDGALMAVAFDVARRRPTGAPVRVDDQLVEPRHGESFAALSAAGTLVYARTGELSARPVLVNTATGSSADAGRRAAAAPKPLGAVGERMFAAPRFAPDGRRVALRVGWGYPSALWVYDLSAHTLSRVAPVTAIEGQLSSPVWTADGRGLLFTSVDAGGWGVWTQLADGSVPPRRVVAERGAPEGSALSPDGRTLLYAVVTDTGRAQHDLHAADPSTGAVRPWLATPFDEVAPAFSPDGRWVAYVSDETGRPEVYVRPFARAAGRVQVSTDGGTEPCWSADGRRLFYRSARRMVAAHLTGAPPAPAPGVTGREVLFEGDFLRGPTVRNYDVAPDGRRFVLVQTAAGAAPEVVVTVGWLGQAAARRTGGQ